VLGYLVGLRRPWLDALMAAVTSLGSAPMLGLLLAAAGIWMGLSRRDWWPLAAMLSALAGAVALSLLAKVAIGRARPEPLYALALGVGSAFPSGHAAQATAGYGALARVLARGKARPARLAIWCATAILVAVVCFSRLYLGVHWLSDVVGGCLLGALWSLCLLSAARAVAAASARRAGR
jgi:undecaprenyl-diphosphatase